MKKNRTRCGGFLWAEIAVATALLGVVLAGLVVALNGFTLVNNCQWARQRCTAAAQAQLESLATIGQGIEPAQLQRLWPGVEVVVERTPGAGPWEGLEAVRVTATAQPGPHRVTVRLVRYLPRGSAPAEGGQS